jgi:hypothetical protein
MIEYVAEALERLAKHGPKLGTPVRSARVPGPATAGAAALAAICVLCGEPRRRDRGRGAAARIESEAPGHLTPSIDLPLRDPSQRPKPPVKRTVCSSRVIRVGSSARRASLRLLIPVSGEPDGSHLQRRRRRRSLG